MNKDTIRKGYDKAADAYLAARDRFKNRKYLEKLSGLLPAGSNVLDIGCGAGVPIDSFLVGKGYHVTGIDISEKQIELAKKNVPGGKFLVKDMASLNEKEFSVDAVVSFYAIFHIPRRKHKELFRIINSYLPRGGLLLVTMGSSDWEGTEKNFFGVTMEWSHYDAETNKRIIRDCGFQILESEIDTAGGEKHLVVLAKKL